MNDTDNAMTNQPQMLSDLLGLFHEEELLRFRRRAEKKGYLQIVELLSTELAKPHASPASIDVNILPSAKLPKAPKH